MHRQASLRLAARLNRLTKGFSVLVDRNMMVTWTPDDELGYVSREPLCHVGILCVAFGMTRLYPDEAGRFRVSLTDNEAAELVARGPRVR